MSRRTVTVLVAATATFGLVVGLVLVATRDDGLRPGEARLEVHGMADVQRVDGERERVTGTETLRRGDRVEVVEGTAQLELAGGGAMELRAALGDDRNTMVTVDRVPVLEAGDLLVVADEPLALEAAATEIELDSGAARMSRDLGVDVGVYAGSAIVDSAGVTREVPALRQLSVPVLGRPARSVRPVRYDAADPWDRRFLGAAIALGEELQGIAETYTASLSPGEGRTAGFYRVVLPSLEDQPAFEQGILDPRRPAGEVLVGAAISDLSDRGRFADRWSAVFRFRDEGAPWGLVALDHGVERGPLLGTVEQALARSPFEFTAPTSAPGTPGSPTTPTDPGRRPATPTTAPGDTTQTTNAPGGTTPTTSTVPIVPTVPTVPTVPPPEDSGVLDPLLDATEPVTEVLEDLLGGVLGGGG
jgi:hypothetical protein